LACPPKRIAIAGGDEHARPVHQYRGFEEHDNLTVHSGACTNILNLV
jgi:hypothetical protein